MAVVDLVPVEISSEERVFVSSFLLDHNVKFAAQRTNIPVRRCYHFLQQDRVKQLILEKSSQIAARCDLNVEQVLNELKRVAFFDVKDIIKNVRTNVPKSEPIKNKKKKKESQEHFIEYEDWENVDGRCLAEVKETIGRYGIPELSIKPYDKMAALKTLAEWFKGGNSVNLTINQINIGDMKNKTAQEAAMDYQSLISGK